MGVKADWLVTTLIQDYGDNPEHLISSLCRALPDHDVIETLIYIARVEGWNRGISKSGEIIEPETGEIVYSMEMEEANNAENAK